MKKILLFACVAVMAAMVVSCGKKKLEGEQIETKYFTVTMPQGWEQGGTSQPDLSCMIHLEGTGKQPSISFIAEELTPKHEGTKCRREEGCTYQYERLRGQRRDYFQ